ncbi:hypothetical protein [Actinoplanes subtropicus]|uniref:hypothetical protein n=1 Tax=Actinoplanes subtropicus TaxID=543632 RepID=UPI0004C3A6A6|nr:hypothetical protein [Actinoplanes subtropicus]
MSEAERKVWRRLPAGAAEAIAGLSGSQLQTLLLAVARDRAGRVRPADLVRRWRQDRFVRPAAADPRAVSRAEARLWELLPPDVYGTQLSPVVPLGTVTAVAPLSQNRIVTATRPVEVLSDPTNALAIEAAARRDTSDEVHVAAAHQVLRAQVFGPGLGSHFRLFALVSSARDTGSGRTEARLLARHLAYWRQVLAPLARARVRYTIFDSPVLRERIAELASPLLVEEPERDRGRGYYTGAALRITAGDVELGDGGFTTWTAQMRADAKERCLISCVSVDRLQSLAMPSSATVSQR